MSAAGARLRRTARREWAPAAGDVRRVLSRDGPRAVPLTLAAVALVGLLRVGEAVGGGPAVFVRRIGVVDASLPGWLALARTPLSLFVPAVGLPVWGALAQVLVVFGVAEITVGRVRTLVVAYAATLAGTAFARWAVPHALFGLGPADALVRDTGPSSAVVALAVFVGYRYRAGWTCAAVVAGVLLEARLQPDLAGREHLLALLAAGVCCLAYRRGGRVR